MPRVTINGDDFGMNESCTNAILRALREGIITDATMMRTDRFLMKRFKWRKNIG